MLKRSVRMRATDEENMAFYFSNNVNRSTDPQSRYC